MNETGVTHSVGQKFFADGTVRRFPGSTVVAPVPTSAPQFQLIELLQGEVMAQRFGQKLSALPTASFHMTVFDLLCYEVRAAEHWSAELRPDCGEQEADRFARQRLEEVALPERLRVRFDDFGPLHTTSHLRLLPADDETAAALARVREQISAATSIRHPNHDRYRFHISLAYILIHFDETDWAAHDALVRRWQPRLKEEFGVLELSPPHLALFEDMFSFPRQRKEPISR